MKPHITQIAVDSDPRSAAKVLGLGEDGKVYFWNWETEEWQLATRKLPEIRKTNHER